ncbi:helix-turn-helix domain-containing protein [Arthrobacter nitrophenolicus]|uniref:helix-turn-helix domain-containing protein n=1 Tax=Arthrobacter nitrophenolicus TaxID=683150 RepID=UPI0030B86480
MTEEPKQHRFLTPAQAADELNVKPTQIHALMKAGELRALQIGGRGYLARLPRLMTIVPEIRGEEHSVQRRVFCELREDHGPGMCGR